jgi:hypothetical protein
MLYEFKSKATGTVVMTGPVAERMLAIIGKTPEQQGIVTVEQLGPAIVALQQAVAIDRTGANPDERDDDDEGPHRPVSLAQRAFPLIEMFIAARAAGRDVTWGA